MNWVTYNIFTMQPFATYNTLQGAKGIADIKNQRLGHHAYSVITVSEYKQNLQVGAGHVNYEVKTSDNKTYTVYAPGVTSEAQLIWMALSEAGWADHPYNVNREENSINITSERLAASMRITPRI